MCVGGGGTGVLRMSHGPWSDLCGGTNCIISVSDEVLCAGES